MFNDLGKDERRLGDAALGLGPSWPMSIRIFLISIQIVSCLVLLLIGLPILAHLAFYAIFIVLFFPRWGGAMHYWALEQRRYY